MKNKIAIIGAGQLGSRHLQGVLKVDSPLEIYVIDPSSDSISVAQNRAGEIDHNHEIFYHTDWENLPEVFDVVIIATNSNVRESVIYKLLQEHKVHNLILEKVLFTEIDAFENVNKLLSKTNTRTWVNHPRRVFESYKKLKIELSNSPKVFQVTGGNWGLACNGLHFLDLFSFLSGSDIKSIDSKLIDNQIYESKRKGFIEFTGSIIGELQNNSFFNVTSFEGEETPPSITIFDNENRFLIQEGGMSAIYAFKKENNYKCELIPFEMEYQSSLTTKIINEILDSSNCDLPTYEEASKLHIKFVNELLLKYNSIKNFNSNNLPIT